mgnify:CR=1 FL=1
MEEQEYLLNAIAMAMVAGNVVRAVALTIQCHYARYGDNDYTKPGLDVIMDIIEERAVHMNRVAA